MKLVIMVVTWSALADGAGYVGIYEGMEQCKQMQAVYQQHVDESAIMVCEPVRRLEPVIVPPPRPTTLSRP